jgi:hypothetical protein
LRCPHCGNENPETHRFCGMCGASLLQGPGAAMAAPGNADRASASSAAPPRPGSASAGVARSTPPESAPVVPPMTATIAQPPTPPTVPISSGATAPRPIVPQPEPSHSPPRVSREEPVISGPSFLGLNQPAPTPERKRASLSIDPSSAPSSRNLDYLLQDEEPRSGGGAWKVVLILIALALAVSFGYLRWKNQGLPFLNLGPKPAPQVPASTETTSPPNASSNASTPANSANTPAGSATPAASTPVSPASNSSSTPASNAASLQPAPTVAPPTATSATSGTPGPANTTRPATSSSPPPAITPATPSEATGNPTPGTAQPSATAPVNAASTGQPDTENKSDDSTAASADDQAKDVDTPVPEVSKPPAAIKRTDTVVEAQKYLYGKGVAQDCDHGLRLLKPAANAGNPKAMIEMGALYSAGLCTPRDLPTSYRWFAMALRKDPANQSVATDLQKLWGEMTQPERQLAIRLSQ